MRRDAVGRCTMQCTGGVYGAGWLPCALQTGPRGNVSIQVAGLGCRARELLMRPVHAPSQGSTPGGTYIPRTSILYGRPAPLPSLGAADFGSENHAEDERADGRKDMSKLQ